MPSEAIKCNQVQSSAINVAVTFAREMPPVGIHVQSSAIKCNQVQSMWPLHSRGRCPRSAST